jgi:hypothetical protein
VFFSHPFPYVASLPSYFRPCTEEPSSAVDNTRQKQPRLAVANSLVVRPLSCSKQLNNVHIGEFSLFFLKNSRRPQ